MTETLDRDGERRLATSAIRGDEAAWRELAARYARSVSAKISQVYLRRVGRNATETEAQEIAQDVFVRLAKHQAQSLRNFRWKCGLATYLSAVAGTAALDRIRADAGARARAGGRVDLDIAADAVPAPMQEPVELAVRGEAVEELRRILDGLSPRDRLVLRMYYWEGMPPAEIARGLGITADYVWVLLKRIHDRIRRKMGAP